MTVAEHGEALLCRGHTCALMFVGNAICNAVVYCTFLRKIHIDLYKIDAIASHQPWNAKITQKGVMR